MMHTVAAVSVGRSEKGTYFSFVKDYNDDRTCTRVRARVCV